MTIVTIYYCLEATIKDHTEITDESIAQAKLLDELREAGVAVSYLSDDFLAEQGAMNCIIK
jgi:hypothetical protein